MKYILIPFCSLFLNIPAYALLNMSGEGEGYCGNFSAFSKGYDAVEWNPANLLLGPRFSLNLVTVGMEYNSNLSFSDFWNLCFSGRYYGDEDKRIFDQQLDADFSAGAQAASVSWSNCAATGYLILQNSVNIPKAVSQLIFYGNVIDTDTVYSLDGIKGALEKELVLSFSGAQNMGQIYQSLGGNLGVGATIKYFQGFYYMGVDKSSGEIVTTMDAIKGKGTITYKTADGGFGWGMDLGFLYFDKSFNVSLSIINFVSDILWTINPNLVKEEFELDSTNLLDFKADSDFTSKTVEEKRSFTTHQQPIIHIGSAIKIADVNTLLLDGGYPGFIGAGINRSISKEWDLRGGISYKDSRVWGGLGAGVKIKAWNLDFGFCMSSPSRFSAALSLSIIK